MPVGAFSFFGGVIFLPPRRTFKIELRPQLIANEETEKMPGFPTQIVGTPTNRGKARRYFPEARLKAGLKPSVYIPGSDTLSTRSG